MLIEADVNDGVRATPLDSYHGAHTRICRPAGLAAAEIDALIDHAAQRLGQRYDVRNVIDLMRYLMPTPPLPGRRRRRMLGLGGGEPTRAICSSLFATAFHSVRYPILPFIECGYRGRGRTVQARQEILRILGSSLLTPRDFDISPCFRIVKSLLEQNFKLSQIRWAEPGLNDTHAPPALEDEGI